MIFKKYTHLAVRNFPCVHLTSVYWESAVCHPPDQVSLKTHPPQKRPPHPRLHRAYHLTRTYTPKLLQPKVGLGKHLIGSSDRKGNQSSKNVKIPWSGGIWKWGLGEGREGAGLECQVSTHRGTWKRWGAMFGREECRSHSKGWRLGKPQSYFIKTIWAPILFGRCLLENGGRLGGETCRPPRRTLDGGERNRNLRGHVFVGSTHIYLLFSWSWKSRTCSRGIGKR